MTYQEYKAKRASMTGRQLEWLKHKCRWEQMGPWAVLNDWSPPNHDELNDDGTARPIKE